MNLEEFTDRFNAELERILGFMIFNDGSTVRQYSNAVAESYFTDESLFDEEGNRDPEECARVDYSYWDD